MQNSGAFTDALGRSPVLKENPQRIVSLAPAITEILFAIGAGEKVVGITQYCDYPPEALSRKVIGGFSGATMSMETIRSLEPDLVLLSADMHARVVSLLDDLGLPSFAVEPRNFPQVYETIAFIGVITGCIDGANEVIEEMQRKITQVKERVQGLERPGVFWLLCEDPLMTAGAETFVSETIELGGGKNIFEDIKEQWPLVSPEQVLLRQPEWVLMGDDIPALSLSFNTFWQLIPAVTEGRTVSLDSNLLYRYGPRLADGVELIAKILHPPL